MARISGVHEAANLQDALEARLVTGNYFDVLEARPFIGRTIAPEDDVRGTPSRVIVLSYSFWRARFQGDPAVIGRPLALRSGWLSGSHGTAGFENGAPDAASLANFTIIGVAARGFAGETVGRTQEIGIRMAIGARSASVVWMVLRDSLGLVAVGMLIGIPSAFLLSRFLDSLLFGLKSNDVSTYAAVALLLGVIAFLAALPPARRASRIDPVAALRCE